MMKGLYLFDNIGHRYCFDCEDGQYYFKWEHDRIGLGEYQFK